MIQNCNFCEKRDLSRVVPFLSIDIQQAIDTGVVLDTGVVESHNSIENPNSVVTRVRDVFQAIDLQKAFLNAGRIVDSGVVGSQQNPSVSTTSGSAPAQSE